MDDTKKMLRAIINGQVAFKQELVGRMDKLEGKLVGRMDKLEDNMEKFRLEVKQEFKKTNSRIDKVGRATAYLEDDTPTREEHDELEKRVARLEAN